MKKLLLTLLCFGACCAHATTTILFNDSWADGGLTDGADATDIAWYGSTGSSALDSNSYTAANNFLSARSGTSGRGFHGVFASQSIANTGDKITVTYSFNTPATVLAKSTALKVGFFDSNGATAQNPNNDSNGNARATVGEAIHTQSSLGSSDAGWDTVYGEAVDLDVASLETSNFGFKSKTSSVTTSRLLNSSTNWTSQGSNVDGTYAIAANSSYVGTFTIENKGSDLYDLSATISSGGTLLASETREDKTIAANAFDIIAFNHSSNAFGSTNSAGVADNGLDYTNIQVAFTQVVPEPSAYALLLGGFAVMLAVARRKQRA
tara:strand:- start:299 stop:1264 length:966 start_codon:yes stop_codon:yes gene_type:complete